MAGLLGMKTAASFASKYKKKIKPLQHEYLKGKCIVHDNPGARMNGKALYWKIGQINGMLKQWQVQSRWSYKQRLDQAYTFVRKLPGVEIVPCKEEQVFYLAESTFGADDNDLESRDLQGDFSFSFQDPLNDKVDAKEVVHVISSSSEEKESPEKPEPSDQEIGDVQPEPAKEEKGQ